MEFDDKYKFHAGSGEVLLLCGDIFPVCDITKYQWFLDQVSERYEQVFWIFGNHEFYDGNLFTSHDSVRDLLPYNITLLENESVFYKGVHYVGCTLWTNFNNWDYGDMAVAQSSMNDYVMIDAGNDYLWASDTAQKHDESLEWLKQCLPTLKGPVVVMTHHAPSYESIQGDYASRLQSAYASDLKGLIEGHSIHAWCHGHIHNSVKYNIGDTIVRSNPRGYNNYKLNPDFAESCTWTI